MKHIKLFEQWLTVLILYLASRQYNITTMSNGTVKFFNN